MIYLDINTPAEFAMWFYRVFMSPIFDVLKNTVVLGFSLFSWILGLSLVALGVRFVRALFGTNDRG